jgi:hypothetical protein
MHHAHRIASYIQGMHIRIELWHAVLSTVVVLEAYFFTQVTHERIPLEVKQVRTPVPACYSIYFPPVGRAAAPPTNAVS